MRPSSENNIFVPILTVLYKKINFSRIANVRSAVPLGLPRTGTISSFTILFHIFLFLSFPIWDLSSNVAADTRPLGCTLIQNIGTCIETPARSEKVYLNTVLSPARWADSHSELCPAAVHCVLLHGVTHHCTMSYYVGRVFQVNQWQINNHYTSQRTTAAVTACHGQLQQSLHVIYYTTASVTAVHGQPQLSMPLWQLQQSEPVTDNFWIGVPCKKDDRSLIIAK